MNGTETNCLLGIRALPLPLLRVSPAAPVSRRLTSKRLGREWKSVAAMIRLYCQDHHGAELCCECRELLDYTSARLERCRFGSDKPACADCTVSCFLQGRRNQVKAVQGYAGLRLLWRRPLLGLRRWLAAFPHTAPGAT